MVAAFQQALKESGYVEGTDLSVEYHWSEGHNERLPGMVADLVQRQMTVIAATTTAAALAAKAATTAIPIVFETASDPVRLGLVASLSRPGGNVTGVTQSNIEVSPKRLELLHELLPEAKVLAMLVNPANPALVETESRDVLSAAHTLGLELHLINASTQEELAKAFAQLIRLGAGGIVISSDPFFTSRSEQLAALMAKHAVPAIYKGREFAAAGGLLSYGADVANTYHLAGTYVGRILKGEKPADMPVQQPTKIELYINMKTAKALGITLPLSLLGRADEVIE